MKAWKILTAIPVLTCLFIACSNPVYVQKDESANFSNYRTFAWVESRASENDNASRPTAYADISIRNAVNAHLQKLGWNEVAENPDVLVSYDILVERSTTSQSDPVYSQPYTRVYYNPYRRRWATIYYPSQLLGYQSYEVPVKEGTVTISMFDSNSDKVVWQGWTTEILNNSQITQNEIERSVRNIFNKFDVAAR
jgi:hypothetical protein